MKRHCGFFRITEKKGAEEGESCVAPITIASIRGNKGHI